MKPPRYWEGKPTSATELNQLGRIARQGQISAGPGMMVSATARGSAISTTPRPKMRPAHSARMIMSQGGGETPVTASPVPLEFATITYDDERIDPEEFPEMAAVIQSDDGLSHSFTQDGLYLVTFKSVLLYTNTVSTKEEQPPEIRVKAWLKAGETDVWESESYQSLALRQNLSNLLYHKKASGSDSGSGSSSGGSGDGGGGDDLEIKLHVTKVSVQRCGTCSCCSDDGSSSFDLSSGSDSTDLPGPHAASDGGSGAADGDCVDVVQSVSLTVDGGGDGSGSGSGAGTGSLKIPFVKPYPTDLHSRVTVFGQALIRVVWADDGSGSGSGEGEPELKIKRGEDKLPPTLRLMAQLEKISGHPTDHLKGAAPLPEVESGSTTLSFQRQ